MAYIEIAPLCIAELEPTDAAREQERGHPYLSLLFFGARMRKLSPALRLSWSLWKFGSLLRLSVRTGGSLKSTLKQDESPANRIMENSLKESTKPLRYSKLIVVKLLLLHL